MCDNERIADLRFAWAASFIECERRITAAAAFDAMLCRGVTVSVDDDDVLVVVGVVSTELKRLRLRFDFVFVTDVVVAGDVIWPFASIVDDFE